MTGSSGSRPRLGARSLLALALTVLAATPASVVGQVELVEVPRPNLEGADALVAERIEDLMAEIDRLATSGETDRAALAAAYGRLGQVLVLYELLDSAGAAFTNARRLAPEDHRWIYYLGTIHQELRELDQARGAFESVLELDPSYVSAMVRLGDIERLDGKPEQAAGWYERVLTLYPGAPAAHWGLAQIAVGQGDSAGAVEHFEAVLEAQPSATAAHYPLALAYRDLGQMDKAREHLEQRGDGGVVPLDPLVEQLSELVTGGSVYMNRGNQAYSRGRYDIASMAYRKAVEADPDDTSARHALATSLSREGRLEEAAAELEIVLQQDPESGIVHYNLGTVYNRLGDLERTLVHYRRAVELTPDLVDARFNYGILLEDMGRYQEALEQYEALRRLDPQDSPAAVRRAALLSVLGRAAEAESDLRRILETDPGDAEARLALGAALGRAGRVEEALAEYRTVIEISEDSQLQARAHFSSGRLLMDSGDLEAGIEQLRSTLELMPAASEVRSTLATSLARVGRFDEAAEEFERVVALTPGELKAHMGRAMSLLLGGRDAEAVAAIEQSLRELPSSLPLVHLLARVLAASADGELRDGERALAAAEQALREAPGVDPAETVAMALAELGRFGEAIRVQSRALEEARRAGADVSPIERRLRGYREGRPARSPWLDGIQ